MRASLPRSTILWKPASAQYLMSPNDKGSSNKIRTTRARLIRQGAAAGTGKDAAGGCWVRSLGRGRGRSVSARYHRSPHESGGAAKSVLQSAGRRGLL